MGHKRGIDVGGFQIPILMSPSVKRPQSLECLLWETAARATTWTSHYETF